MAHAQQSPSRKTLRQADIRGKPNEDPLGSDNETPVLKRLPTGRLSASAGAARRNFVTHPEQK